MDTDGGRGYDGCCGSQIGSAHPTLDLDDIGSGVTCQVRSVHRAAPHAFTHGERSAVRCSAVHRFRRAERKGGQVTAFCFASR